MTTIFHKRERFRSEFESCIVKIDSVMVGELPDTAFHKKALFYSLFCVIYDIVYGLSHSTTRQRKIPPNSYSAIRRALRRLGEVLEEEIPPRKYARFIEACGRQTDNIGPRKIRHRFILDAITGCL